MKALRTGGAFIGGLLTIVASVNAPPASAQSSQPYTWRNVAMVGGGFVPGIVYNQTTPNLVYVRTDIGGSHSVLESSGLSHHVAWSAATVCAIAVAPT